MSLALTLALALCLALALLSTVGWALYRREAQRSGTVGEIARRRAEKCAREERRAAGAIGEARAWQRRALRAESDRDLARRLFRETARQVDAARAEEAETDARLAGALRECDRLRLATVVLPPNAARDAAFSFCFAASPLVRVVVWGAASAPGFVTRVGAA